MMTSKYYVRTNEGAYLQGHANPTSLWTKKVEDAEELDAEIALQFIDKVEDTLRKNVFTYLEPVTLESLKVKVGLDGVDKINDEIEEEFNQEHLLNLLLGKSEDDTIAKISDIDVDDVNHPVHYNQYSFAVIDVIDEVAPTYPVEIIAEMANVIKYVLRAPHKGQLKKDLGKIIWYTQRAIDNLEEK